MRRPDPDKRKRRTARILDNARRLFARHGYDCVSMDSLAAACQLTKPALYYYFEDKRAVLLAVLQAHWKQQAAILDAFEPSADLRETLRAFAERTLAETRRPANADVIRIVLAEAARHPEIGREFFRVFGPTLDRQLAVFSPHLAGRRSRDAALALVHQFVAGLAHYSLLTQMFRPGKRHLPDQRTYVSSLVETLVCAATMKPTRP